MKSPARLSIVLLLLVSAGLGVPAQADEPWVGSKGIRRSILEIQARQRLIESQPAVPRPPKVKKEKHYDRKSLQQAPGAQAVASWPPQPEPAQSRGNLVPLSVDTSFLGAFFADGPRIVPPDSGGAAGPTQILSTVNGSIAVYDKQTGQRGALDAYLDTFFEPVIAQDDHVADPRVRYDRLTRRWFVVGITIQIGAANHIVIAVSDGPILEDRSSFTFFSFRHDQVSPAGDQGLLADFPTLGIDAHALYIGVLNFDLRVGGAGFVGTGGFVVRKSSILGDGPLVAKAFRGLSKRSGSTFSLGPYCPQGVDNDDPNPTFGYFVGVEISSLGQLVLRRISNPGGNPTISPNLLLTVPMTSNPIDVPALGTSTKLEGLDDRLSASTISTNRLTGVRSLWTAHNIEVDARGVAKTGGGRNATRWYELRDLDTRPRLAGSGTLYDAAATNPRSFWMPSIGMNGQGHVAIGTSTAGKIYRAEVAVTGFLAGQSATATTDFLFGQRSDSAYDLQPGSSAQRWGDYSQTGVDPEDGMTFWTAQEYTNAPDSWGVRIIELQAPPPARPTAAAPALLMADAASIDVVLTASSVNGSGFFDPGPGYTRHISAVVSGGVVVSRVTFDSPTQITLRLSTLGASPGPKTVTVTNPDGQSITVAGLLAVEAPPLSAPREPWWWVAVLLGSALALRHRQRQFRPEAAV